MEDARAIWLTSQWHTDCQSVSLVALMHANLVESWHVVSHPCSESPSIWIRYQGRSGRFLCARWKVFLRECRDILFNRNCLFLCFASSFFYLFTFGYNKSWHSLTNVLDNYVAVRMKIILRFFLLTILWCMLKYTKIFILFMRVRKQLNF